MRVDFEQLYTSQDALITLYNDEPFTGVAYQRNDTGQTVTEVAYVNGLQEGVIATYFPSGELRSHGQMHLGVGHGTFRHWYLNGQLEAEELIEYGILVYKKTWDENGNLTDEFHLTQDDPAYHTLQLFRRNYAQGPK